MFSINLGTLCTLGSTTTSTCGDDGIRISSDEIATTLTSSITTATTSSGPIVNVYASSARDYVSSMSVEEIDSLISQIDEKEEVLTHEEGAKVKKLGTINNNNSNNI